jgi:hypothetical protein
MDEECLVETGQDDYSLLKKGPVSIKGFKQEVLEAHQGQPLPKGAVFYEINSFGFLI